MASVTIYLLGPYTVRLDGEPVTAFQSAKARALLAYLAVEAGRPHTRETLAGLLWPDYPEPSARISLSNALSHLRTLLRDRQDAEGGHGGPPLLLVERRTVQLNPQADCWVDVLAFQKTCQGPTERRPENLTGLPVTGLEEAVALYRGPLLEGFSLKDSPPFEQWVLATRERLQRQAMEALGRLSTQYEERGEIERGIAFARRQLEIEPWEEEAHRQLMRLLALSGQRSAALAQYENCRRALKEELDVEPAPETVRLYEQIAHGTWVHESWAGGYTGDLSGFPKPDRSVEPDRSVTQHNLPAAVTLFVGRVEELAELGHLLADPGVRLVTVLGPGGSGKTRLALETAAGQVGRYRDGVWFVSLAPLRSAEEMAPAVAQALGLSLHGMGDPRRQLLDYLRQKQTLLVMDNAEHLLEGAGFLGELLAAAPEVVVLVTSRARLNLQGEHVFHLGGMRVPDAAADAAGPEGWTRYSAVQLFLQSARRADRKRFGADVWSALGPAERGQVVRICRLVQGMPLAILLAASAADVLALDEIAAGIAGQMTGSGVDFLGAEWRDMPERQRSMRATFDHSWNLLAERQREVFGGLSVFRGGCTQQACQEVADATPQELRALVDRSLLQRTATGRFEMHELLREYAAEKLCLSSTAAAAERAGPDVLAYARHCLTVRGKDCVAVSERHCAAIRDRHCAHYSAALARWAGELKSARQQAALAEMDVEIANARAAWEWAVERRDAKRLDQAMEGLGLFYEWRVRYGEGEAAFRAAAEALAELAKGSPEPSAVLLSAPDAPRSVAQRQVWVKATTWQAHFCRQLGQIEQARELLRQSLALLDGPAWAGHNARLEKAFALRTLGDVVYWSGDRDRARPLYAQSLALYRALGERWETAYMLSRLGQAHQACGDFDRAEQAYREALAVYRALGDRKGIADSLMGVAWALPQRGQFDEAERLAREVLALTREMGDREDIMWGLWGLAMITANQGEFAESRSLLEEGLAISDDWPHYTRKAFGHVALGNAEAHLGQYDEASVHLRHGLALARETNWPWGVAAALLWLGFLAMAGQEYAEAQGWLQESVAIWQESGQRSNVGWALAALGGAERGLGRLSEAREHLCQALQVSAGIRDAITLLYALPEAALLVSSLDPADMGKTERAVEIYALASRYPFVAHSRLWEDVAGRHIASASTALSPQVVDAAKERGRARDLWATVEELLAELQEPPSALPGF